MRRSGATHRALAVWFVSATVALSCATPDAMAQAAARAYRIQREHADRGHREQHRPVKAGLVESLGRQGGNVTGLAGIGEGLWQKRLGC